jgi:hypothetical protein
MMINLHPVSQPAVVVVVFQRRLHPLCCRPRYRRTSDHLVLYRRRRGHLAIAVVGVRPGGNGCISTG